MGKYCPLHQICHPSSKCLWVQIFRRSHKVLHSSLSLPPTFHNFLLFSKLYLFECSLLLLPAMVICALSFIFFNSSVQGSFEHLHVLLPANYKWVNRGSNNLCAKKKNSSRALLLVLLLLASLIFVNLKCLKFHCVPSFPPIALVLRFW